MKRKFCTLLVLTLLLNLSACWRSEHQQENAQKIDLAAFYESLRTDENFTADMEVEGQALEAHYPGLEAVATKQSVIYEPMITSSVCEIALVEVENSADVETVENIFQSRIDAQVGTPDAPGGAWYPESIAGWQNDSRIVTEGNYVMLIAWDGCDDVVRSFQALFT